jgi:L-lactate dehydrogenase
MVSMASNAARIAIIGMGHVGSTSAYALMLRALVSEIVLIDSNTALAEAEAADIADANALARPAHIWAGTYQDAATASIAVIAAGAATHGNESRLSVLSRSAVIVGACVDSLSKAGFVGIILVAANPVDIMTQIAFRKSGLAAKRVIGTGTLLDSSRLRQALAMKLDVAPAALEGLVLGEHGDSEVAAFSTVRVGGLTLEGFANDGEPFDHDALAKDVREAGYLIVSGKGYTSFGIATAVVRICEAIIRNERAILPVSTFLTGEFGIADVFLSLPCILGSGGVERILLPDLSAEERGALRRSAEVIRQAVATLDDRP